MIAIRGRYKTFVWASVTVLAIFIGFNLIKHAFSGEEVQDRKFITVTGGNEMVILPKPRLKGRISLEEAIQKRRSIRSFQDKEISLADISQLLWSCQGITDEGRGLRAAPSAGALYPLEIYVVKKDGLFHYNVQKHALELLDKSDLRAKLSQAALGQPSVSQAGVDLIICAVYSRVTSKYGDRGIRYVQMEAGCAAQNVHLTAVSLGLGSVPMGAFDGQQVGRLLGMNKDVEPIYIIPVGVAP